MCGIAGIVQWDGGEADGAELAAMTRALVHRGPDDEGRLVRRHAGLGHTRLAIIDPSGGAQPMTTADGQVALTYNGELYNFRELRSELESLGHRFETRSDTEVVLRAWLQWQERCVERFRGMFAFAIVDWRRQLAFLARDHFGIKPLVYFRDANRLCFASELQALRHAAGFPDEIDRTALDHYLALSYIPAPLTIHRGVCKLPPAHSLVVHFDGRVEAPVRYWELRFEPAGPRAAGDWLDELEQILRDSVRAHLVADVPFGALLSGGVDSSLLVSLMAEERREPVQTFSIGFHESDFDERPYAATVRDRWQTEHHEVLVTPDALAVLPTLSDNFGEPFGDWAAIPTYYLSQMARESVPLVLSGDGADEAFGGYGRHLDAVSLAAAGRGFLGRLRERLRTDTPSPPDWEAQTLMVVRAAERRALWRSEHLGAIDREGPLNDAAKQSSGLSPLRRVQRLDYAGYLPGAILTKVDIASMSHGLEVRTPFVDLRVVEFAATLPQELLVARGAGGRIEGKRPLKKILSRWFPEDFVHRPKQGFVPPASTWFARGGPLRGAVEESLLVSDARIAEYFEPARVRALLADLDRSGFAEPIWLLFALEQWLQARA